MGFGLISGLAALFGGSVYNSMKNLNNQVDKMNYYKQTSSPKYNIELQKYLMEPISSASMYKGKFLCASEPEEHSGNYYFLFMGPLQRRAFELLISPTSVGYQCRIDFIKEQLKEAGGYELNQKLINDYNITNSWRNSSAYMEDMVNASRGNVNRQVNPFPARGEWEQEYIDTWNKYNEIAGARMERVEKFMVDFKPFEKLIYEFRDLYGLPVDTPKEEIVERMDDRYKQRVFSLFINGFAYQKETNGTDIGRDGLSWLGLKWGMDTTNSVTRNHGYYETYCELYDEYGEHDTNELIFASQDLWNGSFSYPENPAESIATALICDYKLKSFRDEWAKRCSLREKENYDLENAPIDRFNLPQYHIQDMYKLRTMFPQKEKKRLFR